MRFFSWRAVAEKTAHAYEEVINDYRADQAKGE